MCKFLVTSLLLFSLLAFAEQTPWQKKFDAYTKDLPKDVKALLQRVDECNHFGGEEPYDSARAKEIAAAVKKLNCDDLDSDTKKITEKYKKQPTILEKIQKFSSII